MTIFRRILAELRRTDNCAGDWPRALFNQSPPRQPSLGGAAYYAGDRMTDWTEFARNLAAPVVALIGALWWFARLEGWVKRNTRDIDREAQERKADVQRIANQRTEDQASRHRDWESMMKRMDEMGTDIKTLLQRTSNGKDDR